MTDTRLADLLRYVRTHSPFYRDLYQNVPSEISSIRDLPIIQQSKYWEANSIQDSQILTGPIRDGILFRSGGSTGKPKFSVFSKEEWESFTTAFGQGIASSGLQSGERIANLFYAGDLYGSFLFITKSLEKCPIGVLQLPIAGSTPLAETFEIIQSYNVTTLAGVPTTLLGFADFVENSAAKSQNVRQQIQRLLFGGEPVHPDQRKRLMEIFPNAKVQSIGYASTDAGLLGYADQTCGPNEHRTFEKDTLLELIDETTGAVIQEKNQMGKIVITNLTRYLMPVIRYPVGDRAMWLDAEGTPDRKFILTGRSDEAARVGPVMVYAGDIEEALRTFQEHLDIVDFQMKIVHRDRKDGLILRTATYGEARTLKSNDEPVIQEIYRRKPLYFELVQKDQVLPIEVEWIEPSQLEINSRTGKLKRVIDQRFQY